MVFISTDNTCHHVTPPAEEAQAGRRLMAAPEHHPLKSRVRPASPPPFPIHHETTKASKPRKEENGDATMQGCKRLSHGHFSCRPFVVSLQTGGERLQTH
jgi:hypothetical protein